MKVDEAGSESVNESVITKNENIFCCLSLKITKVSSVLYVQG